MSSSIQRLSFDKASQECSRGKQQNYDGENTLKYVGCGPYAMQCSVSCNLIQNCLKVQSVSRKLKKSDNVELLKGVPSFCGHGF